MDRKTPDGAAFLDGLSDEDLALFAESLAIQRELEAEDGILADPPEDEEEAEEELPPVSLVLHEVDAGQRVAEELATDEEPIPRVVPLRRPDRPSPFWDRRVLAAAVIAAVALPIAWFSTRADMVREPSQAVALLTDPQAGLPADVDDRSWGHYRSPGAGPASPQARAARVGAYLVDLELAIRAGDVEGTQGMSGSAAALLEGAGNAGPAAARLFGQINDSAGGDRDQLLADLADATDAAEEAVDRDYFVLGAWAQGALTAAKRQDAGYFGSDRTRGTLDRAEKVLRDNAQAEPALARIRGILDSEPMNWVDLQAATDDLLAAIG